MIKVMRGRSPKNRKGQKWRCYGVVRTVPGQPDSRFHVLKCSECGAQGFSRWDATSKIFIPMPCDCGDFRFSQIKVGDVLNNKKILKIDAWFRGGRKIYRVLVKCMNCGAELTITNLALLSKHEGKLQKYCDHCKAEALKVKYTGRIIGTWKVISEDRPSMTCRCIACRHKIVLLRKHIRTLKKRPCPKCLKSRKRVDRDKIIYLLYCENYSYRAIGAYFGLSVSRVREIVDRAAYRFVPPD